MGAVDTSKHDHAATYTRMAIEGVAVAGVVAYAWWVTDLQPFTWSMRLAVGLLGIVLLIWGADRNRRRRTTVRKWVAENRIWFARASRPAGDTRLQHFYAGLVVWGVLIVSVGLFELMNLFWLPRSVHPTLSSLLNIIESSHAVRWVLFSLWLALGWDLLKR